MIQRILKQLLKGKKMWNIYDALIEGIPDHLIVDYQLTGGFRCLVRAGNTGVSTLARNYNADNVAAASDNIMKNELCGRPLKEAAGLAKSWDFEKASLGMAAINAYYNDYALLSKLGVQIWEPHAHRVGDVFEIYRERLLDKKVAMIGHFEYAAAWMREICKLTIFEREPRDGDLPDSAEEFYLPEQDFVFITGMSFTNKTLPRLLELSQNATVILVGPTVPASPILFQFGISCISSLCVRDPALSVENVRNGSCRDIYQSNSKLIYTAVD